MKLKTKLVWSQLTWEGSGDIYPIALVPIDALIDTTPLMMEDSSLNIRVALLKVPIKGKDALECIRKTIYNYEQSIGARVEMKYLENLTKEKN